MMVIRSGVTRYGAVLGVQECLQQPHRRLGMALLPPRLAKRRCINELHRSVLWPERTPVVNLREPGPARIVFSEQLHFEVILRQIN